MGMGNGIVSHTADAVNFSCCIHGSSNSRCESAAVNFRGGSLQTTSTNFVVASWNIEGLTKAKIEELQVHMINRKVEILCLQETHWTDSAYFVTDAGFLLISSGEEDEEYAGVGFLVAPHCRRSVVSFCQFSGRQASLKMRVPGGKMVVCSLYAPHQGKPFQDRLDFYQSSAEWIGKLSRHGPLLVLGDFNARLHTRFATEDHRFGEHIFGDSQAEPRPESNRQLLLELCEALDLVVGNTFFAQPPSRQVTVYNVGSNPNSALIPANFGQIDFILTNKDWLHVLRDVASCMDMALASHHFPIIVQLDIAIPKRAGQPRVHQFDVAALENHLVGNRFRELFQSEMETLHADHLSTNDMYASMRVCYEKVAAECLPKLCRKARRPWISNITLQQISDRDAARAQHNYELEKELTKNIRTAVKKDRTQWLNNMLATGDWKEIRKLRKGFCPKQGRLKDGHEVVESNLRADVLAKHFETVQWCNRVTTEPNGDRLGPLLPVSQENITAEEVITAAKALKNRKAMGGDNMPAEFWKTICVQDSLTCQWAVCLCNMVWCNGHVPDEWHEAVVSAIFKKGDPASCENYRPISLLAIGYKLFATILLRRLKDAGADARIWPTQFGFRAGRGCADALFVARRLLEQTYAAKGGSLAFLALDWAKAFDSISPDGLIVALRRFGIPDGFCSIIRAIYSGRKFVVRDAGHTSEPRPQHFGISQGCPLSPFLFSIVMTVLLFDASAKLEMEVETRQPCVLPINELVYADDTLVVAADPYRAETHMRCIEAMGMNYGLRLNWKKCEVLPIGCEANITAPDGSFLTCKRSISYLGSYLDASGTAGPEICRWHEILHQWNVRVNIFIDRANIKTWSHICCLSYWRLAQHIATLPPERWVRRILRWCLPGTYRTGRPHFHWESKLQSYCRYKGLGPWTDAAMNRSLWDQHCESFIEFCCT